MITITLLFLSIIAVHFSHKYYGAINFFDNSKSENEMYVGGFSYPDEVELLRICDNLYNVLSTQNTSYFDIILDRDAQIKSLFSNSPEYRKTMNSFAYLTN